MKKFLINGLILPVCLYASAAVAVDQGSTNPVSQEVTDELYEEDWGDFDDEFGDEYGETSDVSDPLESINRGIFWFNDKLYFVIIKPVAKVYRIVPKPARVSAANFFSNLATPIRLVNSGLQLKFREAGTELSRFVINSTVGIFGLFDPAERYAGLKISQEDFGQSLGSYGVGTGIYLQLPFLGPSNVRDFFGLVVDFNLHPMTHMLTSEEYLAAKSFDIVNTVSLDKDTYEKIKKESLDPYQTFKNAYHQRREGKIAE